ncbi:MAG: processive 1,2-diacylglycerol beta-glucosyltransferase [bacterium]
MPTRVLIFTASIGAGHDLPAEVLATELRAQGAIAHIVDFLDIAGPVARAIIGGASSLDSTAGNIAFDVSYFVTVRIKPMRRVGSAFTAAVAGKRFEAFIAQYPADVIVSTYPLTTELLGRLRLQGRIAAPTVAAITDLAALNFWAHPSVDLHLVTHPESEPEVRAIIGPGGRIEAVHGFSDLAFTHPPERAAARRELGLVEDGRIVVVSGGGWGVGDLVGATDAALRAGAGQVVVLVGHSETAQARLAAAYGDDERVQVWGFTDKMVPLLAAADVLVHSTAGLTVLEALMCGARVISYGWGKGHIRANNAAYDRLGMAAVARDRPALARALTDALSAPPLGHQVPGLPAAADLVLALAADREPAHAR